MCSGHWMSCGATWLGHLIPETPGASGTAAESKQAVLFSAVPALCVSIPTSASSKSQILTSLGLNLMILLPLLQGSIFPRPRRKRDVLKTCEEQCLGWFNTFQRISAVATIKRANAWVWELFGAKDSTAEPTTNTGWCSCRIGDLCLSLGDREGVRGKRLWCEQWALVPLVCDWVAAAGQESLQQGVGFVWNLWEQPSCSPDGVEAKPLRSESLC